jgi:NitT/TauT family transport system substrate-binding protein
MRSFLLSTLLAVSSSSVAFQAPAQELKPVTLGYVTRANISLAPITLAMDRGFFAEEGIKVSIVEFDGSGALFPQLLAKRVTIGIPQPDSVIFGKQPNREGTPVRFFYNWIRTTIWEIAVLENSPISTLDELKGKKIGVGSLGWSTPTASMLKDVGLPEGTYQRVPVGVGGPAFLALRRGDIDALNLFDIQHAMLEQTGAKIRRLPVTPRYAGFMANGFAAHDDTIKDQPGLLIAFARAVAKATVACEVNKPACIKSFWNVYPSLKPTTIPEDEAMKSAIAVLDARYSKFTSFPEGLNGKFGVYAPGNIQSVIDTLFDSGAISTKEIKEQSVFTNELIDEINKFDRNTVIAKALSFK